VFCGIAQQKEALRKRNFEKSQAKRKQQQEQRQSQEISAEPTQSS